MCEATQCAVCRDGGTRTHARPVPQSPRAGGHGWTTA